MYTLGFLLKEIDGNTTYTAQPKIIGGQPIDIKYRPFMLSLHNSHGFLCGASILSRTWAITALHCLISIPTQYYVRAGSNKIDRGGSVHRVTNIRVYNDTYHSWCLKLFHHDIALLEVKPPFRFSRTVGPVHLPRSTHELPFELLICGWGYINDKKVKSAKTLMGVYVQHVPYETCINVTSSYARLVKDDYHLCYGTQGKDACYGDSGGALASRRTIYGIVSFGHGCGKVAGVYVKVFYYREWIKSVMNL
ncbi:Trypsin-1 [Trachymyrmex septentrionalis]|uniref:trypsin n=1 Tax=Trachymyrmex septentrionalis TaxID=34720 RepID=A0A195EY48_9HYME|nr:Trypsin-1 [Trachymyrmex septentrionalis]